MKINASFKKSNVLSNVSALFLPKFEIRFSVSSPFSSTEIVILNGIEIRRRQTLKCVIEKIALSRLEKEKALFHHFIIVSQLPPVKKSTETLLVTLFALTNVSCPLASSTFAAWTTETPRTAKVRLIFVSSARVARISSRVGCIGARGACFTNAPWLCTFNYSCCSSWAFVTLRFSWIWLILSCIAFRAIRISCIILILARWTWLTNRHTFCSLFNAITTFATFIASRSASFWLIRTGRAFVTRWCARE